MGLLALRPTGTAGWASGAAATNIAEPTAQQKSEGWSIGQAPPSSYENYLRRISYDWISYEDPQSVLWEERMSHFGGVAGPTSFTGGIPVYGNLALVMSPSAGGYSMTDPGFFDTTKKTLRIIGLPLNRFDGDGQGSGQYNYACSPGALVYSGSGIAAHTESDIGAFGGAVGAALSSLDVGFSDWRIAHSGTIYARMVCPTQPGPWWFNVRNIATGSSVMVATLYNSTGAGKLQRVGVMIDGQSAMSKAYIDGTEVASLNLMPTGAWLYSVAGARGIANGAGWYAVTVGRMSTRAKTTNDK